MPYESKIRGVMSVVTVSLVLSEMLFSETQSDAAFLHRNGKFEVLLSQPYLSVTAMIVNNFILED